MHTKKCMDGYLSPIPGIRQKTLVYGEKTLMTEFKLEQGCEIPVHAHPYEQTGYLVSGKIHLTIGDAVHVCTPGDSWSIPENVAHGADVREDAVAIEVFSPVREDYLPDA
jgi:quercetin dioxygenase-like cupin family protein